MINDRLRQILSDFFRSVIAFPKILEKHGYNIFSIISYHMKYSNDIFNEILYYV